MFENNINSLCFSGGGTKGLVFIGAIQALLDKKIIRFDKIDKFIGASAGSVMAFLFSIDYSPREIEDFLIEFNFSILEPTIDCNNLFCDYGIDDGLKFLYVLRMLLKEKTGKEYLTFKELYDITNKELIVTVTSISTSDVKYLSYINSPDHDVALAIRMSVSVPFYYMPVKYEGEFFIDGGILDNYPIQKGDINRTIGLVVASDTNIKVNDFSNYMFATIRLVVNAYLLTKVKKYSYCSIPILCEENTFIDFNMNKNHKKKLIKIGYDEVVKKYDEFIKNNVQEILNDIINRIVSTD